MSRSRRPFVRVLGYAGWVVAIAVLIGWFIFLRPTFLGGPVTYILVSGESMQPTLEAGDLVVARKRHQYEKGDIVVYRIPEGEAAAGKLIVHRVTGGTGKGYVTQGDNTSGRDIWQPTDKDVLGALWVDIPNAQSVISVLRSPLVAATIAAILAAFIVWGPLRRRDDTELADGDS